MKRRRKRQPTVKIIPVLEKPIATKQRRMGKHPTSMIGTTTDYIHTLFGFGKEVAERREEIAAI